MAADGKHIEACPEDQVVVARVRKPRAEGKSLRAIGRALLEEERRPRSGKGWNLQVVQRIVAS